MSDFAKAVEALAVYTAPGGDYCDCTTKRKNCPSCVKEAERILLEILPHLRRMHLAEAAQLIEAENERWELGDTPICYEAWKDAAQFLRGIE